jgi:DNA-binding protein HU-beta
MAKAAKPAATKSGAMTKSAILATVAEKAEITKKQAGAALDALLKLAYDGAKGKDGFKLPGLGKLVKVKRPARKGRNPQTGEAIQIKAKTTVKFRIAKACKDAVLA